MQSIGIVCVIYVTSIDTDEKTYSFNPTHNGGMPFLL